MDHVVVEALERNSRTFFDPIMGLTSPLQDAVASAYLCCRAIDEIEDSTKLSFELKATLLTSISRLLNSQSNSTHANLHDLLHPVESSLESVTMNLLRWMEVAPHTIRPRIMDTVSAMALRMAHWVNRRWEIDSQRELDEYAFDVAGTIGVLLSDLFMWADHQETDRQLAVHFGIGLQLVNIVSNRSVDVGRGVDLFPMNWSQCEVIEHARWHLRHAEGYAIAMNSGTIRRFCKIPLALAWATLQAIEEQRTSLTRQEVEVILQNVGKKA